MNKQRVNKQVIKDALLNNMEQVATACDKGVIYTLIARLNLGYEDFIYILYTLEFSIKEYMKRNKIIIPNSHIEYLLTKVDKARFAGHSPEFKSAMRVLIRTLNFRECTYVHSWRIRSKMYREGKLTPLVP